ncbi:MAG TPA: histidine--tRNA ligase [Terriglobales bacterium]|nr:histidine--tRNA ligase [Terriglobales bacterium]
MTIKAVRGTRDLLPPETELWNRVEQIAREVFALYNFSEIRTPIFEQTELFARGVGEATDIVSKEMYTWEDRARAQSEKAQSLTLRPENTAGVVRAYIEHKLWERPGLQKLYYIGPQFRRERPQKGRYRQFYQMGAEVIGPPSAGSESPARDAEVLEMLVMLLERLEIPDWTLELNSVGSPSSRPAYNDALRKALSGVLDRMCVDCQRRAVTNPLRVFDCKVPEDQLIIETLPRITGFLDAADRKHFAEVQAILKATGVPYVVNDRLVRGIDYYTRTAFEFTQGSLGAQNAILGGGRYDGLSQALGGPPAPGIGFAIGEDRFVMALAARPDSVEYISRPVAYIAPLGTGMDIPAADLVRNLRDQGIRAELGDQSFRLKKAFETAERLGISRVVIVGENEVASNEVAVKDLKTGKQEKVSAEYLSERIRELDVEEKIAKLGKVHELLLKAIDEKKLIRFEYQGKQRIAEPHDYGIQNGLVRLLSYQVGGATSSGRLPAWRWIEVPGISGLEITTQHFAGSRGEASTRHHNWEHVFACVP